MVGVWVEVEALNDEAASKRRPGSAWEPPITRSVARCSGDGVHDRTRGSLVDTKRGNADKWSDAIDFSSVETLGGSRPGSACLSESGFLSGDMTMAGTQQQHSSSVTSTQPQPT